MTHGKGRARGGWWIRFIKVLNGRLEYQILDRHDHHVEGDMAIWEPTSGGEGGVIWGGAGRGCG